MEVCLFSSSGERIEKTRRASLFVEGKSSDTEQREGYSGVEYYEIFSFPQSESSAVSLTCSSLVSEPLEFSSIFIVCGGVETEWKQNDCARNARGEICINDLDICSDPLPCVLRICFQCSTPVLNEENFPLVLQARPDNDEYFSLSQLVPVWWSEYLMNNLSTRCAAELANQ